MAERTRPIRIEFCVTEQERSLIQNKMAQLGTRNMGAYLRTGSSGLIFHFWRKGSGSFLERERVRS